MQAEFKRIKTAAAQPSRAGLFSKLGRIQNLDDDDEEEKFYSDERPSQNTINLNLAKIVGDSKKRKMSKKVNKTKVDDTIQIELSSLEKG